MKLARKRYLSRSRLKMIEVRRKGLVSSLSLSSSSNDPGEITARPQLPATSATMEEGVRHCQLPTASTDSAVDMVTVEPQLPTVSTDCSVEMVGTEEGEDECSDAASACGSNSSSGSDYVPPGEMGRLCIPH